MTTYYFKPLEAIHVQQMCKLGCILIGKTDFGYEFMCNPNEDEKTYG